MLWWVIGILFFFIVVFAGGFIWWLRVYKYKFVIYENRSGQGYEQDRIVRGRLLSIPGSMDQKVFWLPKEKCFYTAYGRKMGKNLYWLYVGPDGWLYNCVAGDLDTRKGVLDIEPVDNDVRAFHTTNSKNIKERYDKPKNWPVVLMSFTIIFAILILVIGGWLIMKKVNEGLTITAGQFESARATSEASERVVVAVDKLLNTGQLKPGLIEATFNASG